MHALLLAGLAALAPRSEVSAPIPQTVLQISLEAGGFRADQALAAQLEQRLPGAVVLAGRIDPAGTSLDVTFHRNQPAKSSAQWRSELSGNDGEAFAHGVFACREVEAPMSATASTFMLEGFVVAAGFAFDVRVVTLADAKTARFSRSEFTKVLDSFRVAFVRYGEPKALPREARDAMHAALLAWPNWKRGLESELARRVDQVHLDFVAGELALLTQSSSSEVTSAHGKALAGFEKLRTPSPEQRFAWMLSEHALGAMALQDGHPKEALPHLQKGYEIACQMRSSARPELAYSLARAQALEQNATDAVRLLDEALAADGRLRDIARRDKAFASLAEDKRFQALTRGR